MVFVTLWEDFEKKAEKLYFVDPKKCRFVTKYCHKDGVILLKLTNDKTCWQYRTENAQDVKKIEKFTSHLMRQMASKEIKAK